MKVVIALLMLAGAAVAPAGCDKSDAPPSPKMQLGAAHAAPAPLDPASDPPFAPVPPSAPQPPTGPASAPR